VVDTVPHDVPLQPLPATLQLTPVFEEPLTELAVRVLEIGRHSDKSYDAIYEGIQKRIKRGTYDDFQPLS